MTEDKSHEPLTNEHLKRMDKILEDGYRHISLLDWTSPEQQYMRNLRGNFEYIWMMLSKEYILSDEHTEEHKLAEFLLDVLRAWVDTA